jgi:putative FmdB family regulatory protein
LPIYEFICQSCGNEFEQIRSFSDSTMPTCANCGSTQVERLMGRPAIHFKGSGWYVTDSKKSSDKKNGGGKGSTDSSKSEGTTESSTESGAETKSETKTETKSDSSTESKSANKSDSKGESKSESSTPAKSAPAAVASD